MNMADAPQYILTVLILAAVIWIDWYLISTLIVHEGEVHELVTVIATLLNREGLVRVVAFYYQRPKGDDK